MSAGAQLAGWTSRLTLADVPPDVQAQACAHLVDGLGTAVAAATTGAAAPAVDVATGLGGPPEATIIGTAHRVSAFAAAVANGTLVHALDFDDTHAASLVHATAIVLPVAFAVGEERGSSGAEVLAAAIAGYELVCRLAAAAPQSFHARGAHPTSVCGAVAAALVAGKLSGLSQQQMEDAIGIVVSQASGVMEFLHTGGSTKQFHAGWAAGSGIIAARLAAAGLAGPSAGLEGEFGLYRVFADRPPDLAVLTDDLGGAWQLDEITIKPYPSCQLMHASLDAAKDLRATVGDIAGLRDVVAAVPSTAAFIVCEPRVQKVKPRSPYGAKFSLPWSVAAMLVDGVVGRSTYATDQLDRPELTALAARITHEIVPYDGPDAEAPGRLRARTHDGRHIEALVARSSGSPGNPLGADGLRDKLQGNLGSESAADSMIAAVDDLASAPDVGSVMRLVSTYPGVRRG